MEIPSGILPFKTRIDNVQKSENLPQEKNKDVNKTCIEWGKVCRVCASAGSHEIFAKIPIYLHGDCNEYLSWQKPINKLIEETTGLKVSLFIHCLF